MGVLPRTGEFGKNDHVSVVFGAACRGNKYTSAGRPTDDGRLGVRSPESTAAWDIAVRLSYRLTKARLLRLCTSRPFARPQSSGGSTLDIAQGALSLWAINVGAHRGWRKLLSVTAAARILARSPCRRDRPHCPRYFF